jgi:methionine synthase II (cobalamin-independent)
MAVLTPSTDLQQAYADYDSGKIKQDELFRAQDRSVEDSLSNMAKTGETLITDGEQRASS